MNILQKLEKALSASNDKLDELQKEKLSIEKSILLYNNECFIPCELYEDEKLTEQHIDWCFDNNIVMRIVMEEIPGSSMVSVEGYMFKNAEDATAFKLKWV